MNRRISGEPRLADYISRALEPHIESIEDWTKEDFVALFFGFGNLTLETPARYVFRQTFWRISVDICLALDELGLGDLDYEERDFYYSITSAFSNLSYPHHAPEGAPQPAEGVIHMRADLFKEHQWDASIVINAENTGGVNEDVEMSQRMHANNITLSFDKDNTVWHNDNSYKEYSSQTLKVDIIAKHLGVSPEVLIDEACSDFLNELEALDE